MPIYLGARDLAGMFVGTHQFIVLVSDKLLVSRTVGLTNVEAKFIGKKDEKPLYGIVIGAQNRGNLVLEFFEKSDYQATMEYFGGQDTKWYQSDFDAEMLEVDFGTTAEQAAIDAVLFRTGTFLLNQSLDPIRYPTNGFGYNSNSWAQSVIQYAGGKVVDDLGGLDVGSSKRIPQTYFEPFCPVNRRPKVNK